MDDKRAAFSKIRSLDDLEFGAYAPPSFSAVRLIPTTGSILKIAMIERQVKTFGRSQTRR
jgi:hypothetical protein